MSAPVGLLAAPLLDRPLWLLTGLLLAGLATVHAGRWLRLLWMDHKHNQGKFVLSRWNGLSNLVVLYRNLDELYDFFIEVVAKEHYAKMPPPKQGIEAPDRVPNGIIQLPLFRLTSLSSPCDLEHVLKKNFDNYPKGPTFSEAFRDLLGEGIFAVDGHKWKSQRKTASHEFTVTKFREFYMQVFNKNTNRLIELVASRLDSPIEIQELFQRYTLDSIGELGFGVSLGCLESEDPPPFAVAFDAAQAQLWRRIVTEQLTWKVSRLLRIGAEGQMRGWIRTLREFTQDVIDKRRRLLASQPDAVRTGGDILSRFMLMSDSEGRPLSDQQLRDVVLNFIIAGRDTTSNALSWAIHLIADHPQVESVLLNELAGLGRHPEYEDLSQKARPFLHAVVHETLRLYPSVPVEMKMALNDDFLPDGTFVPAGSFVSFSPYCQGRDQRLWGPDAAEFRPGRWLDDQGKFQRVSQFKFPAFNGGYRLCLGMDMALLEIKTMLALLLSQYKVTKQPGQCVQYAITLTCPMKAGLKVLLTPRD